MPYIKQKDRTSKVIDNPGKLNYVITELLNRYINAHGPCYAVYNEVLGVLTAIQYELYRRRIAPYEDQKIKENGDVY